MTSRLKGLAEYLDVSLGELLEGIVLHAFEGKAAFGEATREVIRQLSGVYDLDLRALDSHHLSEEEHPIPSGPDSKALPARRT